jgi:hypothetical protein
MSKLRIRMSLICPLICLFLTQAGSAFCAPAGTDETQPNEVMRPGVRGFALQKVGSRYEPVVRYREAFRLPSTTMRFAAYTYFQPGNEELGVSKWGFVIDDGRFFYVDEAYARAGDPHYGLAGNYFVVDGSSGGSGIGRSMYLFRYGKDSVKLLDVIRETYGRSAPPAFMSDYGGPPAYGHELREEMYDDVPVWMITEKDRDGNPLIRLGMIRDLPVAALGPEQFEVFHLYLKIVKDRLRVALDRDLYARLFSTLGDGGGRGSRSTEYYVSGFLSGKVGLAAIRKELAGNKHRIWLVDVLRHAKQWDATLHNNEEEPMPRIREYRLNGR